MRRLVVIFAVLAASGTALAQPKRVPEVIQPQEQIDLAVGESRTLQFPDPFQKVGTSTEGIALVVPQSDRTLTVSGVAPGLTSFFVQGPQGELTYLATVTVTPSIGRLVRHYGATGQKDFIGFYCSENGCGRANPDKTQANGGRDPDEPVAQSFTRTQPTPDGGSVSTTNQYRR